ncbi:hypothetical protein [Amycolatopsis sp. cg9]|uniref:hypothetical protein n=1 Tax=Amycolatopsis sp. cg9 TaxID=3238801 RepID=UPI003525EF40
MEKSKKVARKQALSAPGWVRRSGTALSLAALAGSCAVAVATPAVAAPMRPTGQSSVQTTCSTCNGTRYQSLLDPAVYLVIDGLRHHVPDRAPT